MARKKKSGGDEGGGYNFMDTYGDLVTLLLCFFVLLFASSSMDTQKWQDLVMALSQGGASVVLDPIDPGPPRLDLDTNEIEVDSENAEQQQIEEDFSELYQKMLQYVEENDLATKVEVEKDDTYIYMSFIDDDIFFQSGSAQLSEQAPDVLDNVGEILVEYEGSIDSVIIEGHTDNRAINTSKYPSNWELSSDRAMQVARYMMFTSKNKDAMDHSKYRPMAMGEYHPIEPNDTDEGRARNRRVVFVIAERIIPLNQSEF